MIQLPAEKILLDQSYQNWKEALTEIGQWMTQQGGIKPAYIQSMIERQEKASVYIGNFVALPHGTDKDEEVVEEGIYLVQVPDGVDFGTKEEPKIATLLFVVALKKEHQLVVLQDLAFFCSDIDQVMALSDAETIEEVQMIFEHGHI
ncbi:PTS sugar transporter subunit IIA [Enterococcus faecium]|uniref:PTS sugar transporter subunit IIA n=1 Tax=Enterococcus faecium TaxID=1352 RepID=UPI00178251B2|nr:PTS sugar transporter subunit IIA [Enterococcus faecium]EMF0350413.1 PTS sugar transporter subunit IIA [Enterococcus faecium]MBD9775904.1 PTS sugar transporter subunit IIA [Enterococcus faecium]